MVGSVGGLKNSEMLTDADGGTNGWVGLKHLNTYSCVECRIVPLQYESWTNEKFFMIAEASYYSIIKSLKS